MINSDYSSVYKIDQSINKLVNKIELLNYVNPININLTKKAFFSSKFNSNPLFKYPKIPFNGYDLHQKFFSHQLDSITDLKVRQLYEDIIYRYSGLVECIETIGHSNKFYYNSLRCFGTPNENSVENAKFILRFTKSESSDTRVIKKYSVDEAVDFFNNYRSNYDFDFKIKVSNKMSAIAMVLNNTQTLVLNKNSEFTEQQLNVLANHEIGVHLVTTFNGLAQPLKIFHNGFPNNVETQEGIAVLAEYYSGNLTINRLKELALRVLAVDSLSKGYDFKATFDLLYNQYKLDKEAAFNICLRVHRAGGFTKDHLYLSGLSKVFKLNSSGQSLDRLFTGKVSIEYLNHIEHLINMGLATECVYNSLSFQKNINSDSNMTFILKHLK